METEDVALVAQLQATMVDAHVGLAGTVAKNLTERDDALRLAIEWAECSKRCMGRRTTVTRDLQLIPPTAYRRIEDVLGERDLTTKSSLLSEVLSTQ